MRYECAPGKHLFWARSENRDFVRADLEAGKIYVIEVVPMLGAIKAAVRLEPVNSLYHKMKGIQKIMAKKPPETFSAEHLRLIQAELDDVMRRGLEKAAELGQSIQLHSGYSLEPEDFIFVKKKG